VGQHDQRDSKEKSQGKSMAQRVHD
jgi:hypothetical protein